MIINVWKVTYAPGNSFTEFPFDKQLEAENFAIEKNSICILIEKEIPDYIPGT